MPFGQLGQTVTVVNKSGKIVSNVSHPSLGASLHTCTNYIVQSKQLVNVWKEAKAAYRERKAEIGANREAELEQKRSHRRAQQLIEDDRVSRSSSRASKSSRHPHRENSHRHAERPPVERGYTDSFYVNDNPDIEEKPRRKSAPRDMDEDDYPIRSKELIRRHTDGDHLHSSPTHRRHSEPHNHRANSARSSIDMDLAYGDLPPPLPVRRFAEEDELKGKMSNLTMMLNEANCLQYSVTSMVEHLQKNPDALAAVALTLAEISNLATKMAPGALMALKGSFPAVIALLASPQFLIAAGLGVGITVVMLGGYKIIKRLKDKKEEEEERELENPLEMQELEGMDLSAIEMWRRGIADAEADGGIQSTGTSVDGEFITPSASKRLTEDGVLQRIPEDAKSTRSHKSKSAKPRKPSRDDTTSKAGSTSTRRAKDGKKKKAPSGLRLLFQGSSARREMA